MATENIRMLVGHLREVHQELAAHYHRLAESQQTPRLKMLLDYLGEHEDRLVHTLSEYGKGTDSGTLESWNQWLNDPDPAEVIASVDLPDNPTEDDIADAAIKVSQSLIDFYRSIADDSVPDRVSEALHHLIALEEGSLKQVARDTGRLRDL